jgi:hypothetical protein
VVVRSSDAGDDHVPVVVVPNRERIGQLTGEAAVPSPRKAMKYQTPPLALDELARVQRPERPVGCCDRPAGVRVGSEDVIGRVDERPGLARLGPPCSVVDARDRLPAPRQRGLVRQWGPRAEVIFRPAPTRQDHRTFCETEGWELVRDARGRASGHHAHTYELQLYDGKILRTRISDPPDGSTYGKSIWSHILHDQLNVDEQAFWACVRDGVKPERGEPEVPPEALPADLVHLLITRLGLSAAEFALMSREEAIAKMQQSWLSGGGGSHRP